MNQNLHRFAPLLIGLFIITLALVSVAVAGTWDSPPALSNFVHEGYYSGAPYFIEPAGPRPGKEISGKTIVYNSPMILDMDQNLANGQELLIAGGDGWVYLYGSDGNLRWQKDIMAGTMNYPCTPTGVDFVTNSPPAVADLDGSGDVPDVIIGYGTILVSNCEGGIVVLNGASGAVKWRYSLTGNATGGTPYPEGPEGLAGVATAPAVADTDGDGKMEIGFGAFDRKIYLLNYNGTRRWYYNAADTIWSSAAFYDIDNDGKQDLIIGSDISANPSPFFLTSDGGYVYAFGTDDRGGAYLRFPLTIDTSYPYKWRVYFDQVIYSSPVIADVLPGNAGPEIIVGAGCYFPTGTTNKNGKWVKILRLSDGAVLQTLNAPNCTYASVAVGDIDSDGELEIVTISNGLTGNGGDGKSRIIAWDPEASASPKWVSTVNDPNDASTTDSAGTEPDGDLLNTAVIADLDGNGSLEVLVSNSWTMHVLRGTDGVPLTCQSTACGSQMSMFAWYTLKGAPAIGNADLDADVEVFIGGSHIAMGAWPPGPGDPPRGMIYVWTDITNALLGSSAGTQSAYSVPWPMFRGGPQRTGHNFPPSLRASTSSIFLLHQRGDTTNPQLQVVLSNDGDNPYNWTASVSAGPNGQVSVSPTSGTVAVKGTLTVTVPVSGIAGTVGDYDLGTITITAPGAVGSPATISVDVKVVATLRRLYLPLVTR